MNARLLASWAALALAFSAFLPVQGAAARPVAAEDLYKIAFVSDPQIAPDGSQVVFVVGRANGPKDRYDTNLYIVRTNGTGLREITTTGRDSDPAWSPDSRTIAFVRGPSKKGERPQIYAYNTVRGNARKLTSLKGGAFGPVFSNDGTHIAFGSTIVDPPHAAYVDFRAAGFKPGKDQQKTDVRIIHDMHFEVNGEGYTYDRHAHIWVMNADGSGARAITGGTQWSEGNPHWSPDGKTIAFDSLRRESPSSGPNNIYTISSHGGAMHEIASTHPANCSGGLRSRRPPVVF